MGRKKTRRQLGQNYRWVNLYCRYGIIVIVIVIVVVVVVVVVIFIITIITIIF
jgi:hypothetical protein